jgi:rhamnopyranosyl-N-acetylglucosaminyl-diphospho-decaprenol beta-1,3/1,4-galactofuranosyltransferase
MRIAAVVVTYQRPQLLQLVVAALHRQQRAPDRIIIVDNGCDAATAAVIPQLGDVELLRSGANLGGAGGPGARGSSAPARQKPMSRNTINA